MPRPAPRAALLPLSLIAVLMLGACAQMKPEPLTPAEITAVSGADRQRAQQDVPPLQGPLTLPEAIARALKYNLDQSTHQLEQALARDQFEAGRFDELPRLVASAGYHDRSTDLVTRSKDSVTGAPSLANPYISSDRSVFSGDLSFTWSLLDFGQSYYASKESADRLLIAAEHRRKAMHTLVQDVRTAFWRAASAQKLHDRVQAAITDAEGALKDSREAQAERLRNPVDALRYQRELLENLRLLETIEQELSTARVELAALIDLPPGQELRVAEPVPSAQAPWLDVPVDRLEELAIGNNADLREAFYDARIARLETRRTLLKMFPGLSFSYGPHASSDSYLVHRSWNEAGVQLSFDLLGLLSAPARKQMADAGVALADQRRMATQMALLAQVHIARLQYGNALHQFKRADENWQVDSRIAEQVSNRAQAQTQTQLDRVANQTAAILSELRRYQALAQAQAAAGKLQATLGLEPVVGDSGRMSLPDLTKVVSAALAQWDQGLPAAAAPAASAP